MRVAGSTTLAAAPDALWAALADPERLSRALPNVDAFGPTAGPDDGAGGSFAVTIRPALALGEVPFRTVWRPLPPAGAGDADAAGVDANGEAGAAGEQAIRYRVAGRGDEHRFALEAQLKLAPADGGGTRAAWHIDCRFTGTLASVGQRVLAPIVDRQVRDVLHAAAGIAA